MNRLYWPTLLILSFSLSACAGGYYYSPYGYQRYHDSGYSRPYYGGYGQSYGYAGGGYRGDGWGHGHGWQGRGWGEGHREGHGRHDDD
jgi:hypothetical protein